MPRATCQRTATWKVSGLSDSARSAASIPRLSRVARHLWRHLPRPAQDARLQRLAPRQGFERLDQRWLADHLASLTEAYIQRRSWGWRTRRATLLRVRQVASGNYAADSSQMTTLSGEARRLANLYLVARAVAHRRQARDDRRSVGISADSCLPELRDALWRRPGRAAVVREQAGFWIITACSRCCPRLQPAARWSGCACLGCAAGGGHSFAQLADARCDHALLVRAARRGLGERAVGWRR